MERLEDVMIIVKGKVYMDLRRKSPIKMEVGRCK